MASIRAAKPRVPSMRVARLRRLLARSIDLLFYSHRKLIGYAAIQVVYLRRRRQIDDYVIVSPRRPRRKYTLWKLAMLSGIRMLSPEAAARRKRGRALAHFWHMDETWDEEHHPELVNGRCRDISKSHVDAVFEKVFGYSTRIDPTRFHGIAVKKPEKNCAGAGVLIECPIAPESVDPAYIYQMLIDNVVRDGVVREYRVVLMFGTITDVTIQDRKISRRLFGRGGGGGLSYISKRPEDVFSDEEIEKICRFCAELGLDFAELDLLPSTSEGRFYILDANKTPTVMVSGSAFQIERFRLLMERADVFARLLRGGEPEEPMRDRRPLPDIAEAST